MSQVNFFMSEDELVEFLKFIISKDILILEGDNFESEIPVQVSESFRSIIKENSLVTLIDKQLFNQYKPEFLIEREKWVYPLFESPTIELIFSKNINSSKMLNGRIFGKIGWLETVDDNKRYKSVYGKLERWIKKRCSKVKGTWWISEDVKEWSLNENGELAFGHELALTRKLTPNDFTNK